MSAVPPTGESSGDKKLNLDFVLLLTSISKSVDSKLDLQSVSIDSIDSQFDLKLDSQAKFMDWKIESVVDSIDSKFDLKLDSKAKFMD